MLRKGLLPDQWERIKKIKKNTVSLPSARKGLGGKSGNVQEILVQSWGGEMEESLFSFGIILNGNLLSSYSKPAIILRKFMHKPHFILMTAQQGNLPSPPL